MSFQFLSFVNMDLRQLSTVTSKLWFLLLPDSHLTLCLVGVAAVLLLLNRNLSSTGRRLSSYYPFSWLSNYAQKIPSKLVFTENALRKHSITCNSLAHTVNSIYTLPGKWYTFHFVASQPRNNFRTLKVFLLNYANRCNLRSLLCLPSRSP